MIIPPNFDITIKYRNNYSKTLYTTSYKYKANIFTDKLNDYHEIIKWKYNLVSSDYK